MVSQCPAGHAAAEVVARYRERGVTAEMVVRCTCEELAGVNELGVSVEPEAARAGALFDYDELERRVLCRLSDGGAAASRRGGVAVPRWPARRAPASDRAV